LAHKCEKVELKSEKGKIIRGRKGWKSEKVELENENVVLKSEKAELVKVRKYEKVLLNIEKVVLVNWESLVYKSDEVML